MENFVTMDKLAAALTPAQDMATVIQTVLDRIGAVLADGVSADSVRQHALSVLYPVGSVYLSASDASPAAFMGGTWEQIKDVFLESSIAANAGTSDPKGEAEHALTVNEMPSHKHNRSYQRASSSYGYNGSEYSSGTASNQCSNVDYPSFSANITTSNTGGNQAHNNMPPYLAISMWKRVA